MRPPARTFQMFSLLIGAIALVLSSAGLVGASPVEGEDAPGNSATAVPEHAAEKQGGPNADDANVDDDTDNTNDDVADDGDNAHPSGKDRSVEPGNSEDQGKAESDPDDDGNGPDRSNDGADKPGGDGGLDKADQDGNNGCGNDDDFEDDNEGWCLGKNGAPGQQVDDDDTTTGDDDDSDVDDGNNAGGAEKVTICHATGSETNPYNLITVSVNSILNPAGHGDHEDDIIPRFDGFDGQGDLDLIEAGCEVDDDTTTDDDDSDVEDGDDGNNAGGADKVTLCHATGSETNPYVVITVSKNAVLDPAGHGDHEDDIIPGFDGFEGQGDTSLIDDGCELDDEVEIPEVEDEDDDNVEGGNEDNDNDNVDEGDEDVRGEVVVNVPTPTPGVSPATPATPAVAPATPASPAVQAVADRNPQVLGSQVTRSSQLPRTGDETTNLVPFGLGLVLLGFGLQLASKRFSAARAS